MHWNHNAFYHRLVLAELPERPLRVLDVGCGRGDLAITLAARADQVDALDRDPGMVEAARARVPANVRCLQADVLTEPLEPGCYDAITSITALHHMPLKQVLPRLAAALKPGGVLAAVALPRHDWPLELPLEPVRLTAHFARGRLGRVPEEEAADGMPMMPGPLTVRQVRAQARAVLPGVRVRRLLYWRYSLIWHKPQR